MSGFLGYKSFSHQLIFMADDRQDLIREHVQHKDKFYLERCTINKFQHDKFIYEDESIIFVLDGVILNAQDICKEQKCESFQNAILVLYKNQKLAFLSSLRGSFSGVVYNKQKDEFALFTDQIGSKPIFYYSGKDCFIFGSDVRYVTENMKKNDIKYDLNVESAYSLLTLGYTIEGNTMFNEIRQVKPGSILFVRNAHTHSETYFTINNNPDFSLKEADMIEQIDYLFRQAIIREFNKDEEYGYKHFSCLSAGLDSRMVNWVAHDIGYNNILNVSFSQSGYYDELTPPEIAEKLKNDWIFKSLDNGNCLYLIDEVVRIASGTLFYGSAHLKSVFNIIDMNQYGLIHTGQLGDVILGGTYYSSIKPDKKYTIATGAYSTALLHRLPDDFMPKNYPNEEIYRLYTRGFCGINQGLFVRQEKNETYSAFYDIDFMSYCLSIPIKYRFGHYIYDKWILQKYPDAAAYRHNGKRKIGSSNGIKLMYKGRPIPFSELPRKIADKIKCRFVSPLASKHHMNPLDYWYRTNTDLRTFLDRYYEDNIERLASYPQLKSDCEKLYSNYSSIEKNAVLTLLAVMKNYI